jgi:hypothetical protein
MGSNNNNQYNLANRRSLYRALSRCALSALIILIHVLLMLDSFPQMMK